MRIFRKFLKSTRANVTMLFAASAIPLIGAGGMAVDYMNASAVQSRMQQAVDDAVIAAAASGEESNKELAAIAKTYLKQNGLYKAVDSVLRIEIERKNNDAEIELKVKGKIATKFMGLVGYNNLEIKAEATATRDFGNLELALVLDTTGSMNANGKLRALKKAAKELVDELHDKKGSGTDLKIGIVPFSKYVNIGRGNRSESWTDIPRDYSRRYSYWARRRIPGSAHNCRRRSGTYYSDGVPHSYSYKHCQYRYGRRYRRYYTARYTWRGCVGSRDYPLNVRDEDPGVRIPGQGMLNVSCSRPITELTDSHSKIKREINRLSAWGSTYIPAGLMWGWRVLSPDAPFEKAVAYSKMSTQGYVKAIVLMTDGANTVKPTYPLHRDVNFRRGEDAETANDLTAEICQNIKRAGANNKERIVIYTIAFDVSDDDIKNVLKNCATNSSYYFDAADATALSSAFEKIGDSLLTLRLAK